MKINIRSGSTSNGLNRHLCSFSLNTLQFPIHCSFLRSCSSNPRNYPRKNWTKEEAREFILHLLPKVGITDLNCEYNHWKKLKRRDFIKLGGNGLLSKHGTIENILKLAFPEKNWDPLKLVINSGKNFYNKKENRVLLMEEIRKKLKIEKLEDWYEVTYKVLFNAGGSKLLRYFQGNQYLLLKDTYPDFNWEPELFTRVPHGYWQSKENRINFILKVAKSKNLKNFNEWYQLSQKDFVELGGKGLLNMYSCRVFSLLKDSFPEFSWDELLNRSFENLTAEQEQELILRFILRYSIKQKQDWYRLSYSQVNHFCNPRYFFKQLIPKFIPEFEEESKLFSTKLKKSNQRWLFVCIEQLFPCHFIIEEYEHPKFQLSNGYYSELDIYIPSLELAFEYQGEHHYDDLLYSSFEMHLQRDSLKLELSEKHHLTIIRIPYWWDKTPESILLQLRTRGFIK